jgi:histidinol phosphatase-like PHP family hydrolase
MEIINSITEDFHIHSLNFSDGMNTVDDIVKYAGEIGLTKIAITDHCQMHLDKRKFIKKNHYNMTDRWKNVYNEVEVKFGIEADLLNEEGDVCMDIQGFTSEFILLSSHPAPIYPGDPKRITEAYLNAIERFHEKISFLAHPCSAYFEDHIDIIAVTELCNKYEIPMEFNCANFVNNRTNLRNLKKMLSTCNQIYVNSDAHTLNELKVLKKIGMQYLTENY